MARAIHHLALGAHDVERVAAFYRELFALEERARHHDEHGGLRSIWLAAADILLMVERTTDGPRRVSGVGAGPFLIAFATTSDERPTLEARAHALGGVIESRTDFSSYLRDPEGNRVAFSTWPARSSSAGAPDPAP